MAMPTHDNQNRDLHLDMLPDLNQPNEWNITKMRMGNTSILISVVRIKSSTKRN